MKFAGQAKLNTLGLNVFGASITAPLVHAVNMSFKPHPSALVFMNGLSQTTSCNRNSQYSNSKRLNNLDVGVMSQSFFLLDILRIDSISEETPRDRFTPQTYHGLSSYNVMITP